MDYSSKKHCTELSQYRLFFMLEIFPCSKIQPTRFCLSQSIQDWIKSVFLGCLPRILPNPFLNTLRYVMLYVISFKFTF